MNNRPNLGFDDDEAVLAGPAAATPIDLSEFQPKVVARPDQNSINQAAEKASFKSRESKPAIVELPVATKATRRRRTGRSSQLNLKVRPDTIKAFYAIADAQGWVLGEAFEIAVSLLEKEHSK